MYSPDDETTIAALIDSAKHWDENARAVMMSNVRVGSSSCALCHLFLHLGGGCGGCPVREHTGSPYCIGTPWQQAQIEHYESRDERCSREFTVAAKKEADFLWSLVPEDKQHLRVEVSDDNQSAG